MFFKMVLAPSKSVTTYFYAFENFWFVPFFDFCYSDEDTSIRFWKKCPCPRMKIFKGLNGARKRRKTRVHRVEMLLALLAIK